MAQSRTPRRAGDSRIPTSIALFSYGTLRRPGVQLANYGRLLEGAPDALAGFRLEPVAVDDPEVVRISGEAVHRIARRTGDPSDRVDGTVFELTPDELPATDRYEVEAYARIEADLVSGRRAFVYVAADAER